MWIQSQKDKNSEERIERDQKDNNKQIYENKVEERLSQETKLKEYINNFIEN